MATIGFLYSGGTYTTIDDPIDAIGNSYPTSINDLGQITGWYQDASGIHGFLADPIIPPVTYNFNGDGTATSCGRTATARRRSG